MTEDEMVGWHNDSMGMNLIKLQETVKDRESWLQPMRLHAHTHKLIRYLYCFFRSVTALMLYE